MSRFEKLTHVIWHGQYHIVWVLKYRFRVLCGAVKADVENSIQVFCSQLGCRVVELNIQADDVHLLIKVPPKVSISKLMGTVKGGTALRLFTRFPYMRQKYYWGNHFWAKGYCVDTVGVDAEMIRKYVKYQEKKERLQQEIDFRN
ncbi:IS200/IS605 family transposase [Endozoicomonas sp.]|nr:IS200/IS605 family transposase [Endozoicomonas sp.]